MQQPKIYVVHLRQCDPRKCTAIKLKKFNLVKLVRSAKPVPRASIVLHPNSSIVIGPEDLNLLTKGGLAAVDCSWERFDQVRLDLTPFNARRLPYLLAANPTNYAMPGKLSTAEALASALYLLGCEDYAKAILSKFKWGEAFLLLNEEPLSAYRLAKSRDDIYRLEEEFIKAAVVG